MPVQKVFPLKIESTSSGGGQEDMFPVEINALEDSMVMKEILIVDDETNPKTQAIQQGLMPSSSNNRDIALFDRNSGEVGLSYLLTKSQIVANTSFTGNPKKYTVVFATAYPDTNYSIDIDGVDQRVWSYESKTVSGFIINANANTALTGEVSWKTKRNIG